MIGKKINQLATELAPVSTDLTIIGDPTTGVSKKITLAQLGAIFSGAVSFYTNLAAFPNPGTIDVIYCAKDTKKLYLWSGSAYVEVFPSQALLDTYQLRSEKGVSNGYASLDSGGKVPISQLPSSIMEYKGTWNAATNTPTLANGTGDTGDVYLCNVAGTVNFGAGPITFAVGDYVIYSGSIWQRSSGAVGTVTSVAASITGDAIGITGSPITTSGTLALAFAGNSTQYVNGAGNLVTFPGIINEAQNLITEVYNKTGATLTKGTVVYINGGQGNLPTITKALATGDSTSAQTYGIVRNDITNNNNGYVVVAGRISDLDTQAFTEGTQLYLSPTTAGTYTSTKPYAPNHLVYVGIVVRAHPTQGVIEVKIQNGYELDELHNVSAQSPTNNDGIFYNSATSLWEKKSIATVLGYTPQAQLNGTGFVKASGTTISYDNSTYVTIDTFENITASKNFTVGLSLGAAGGGNQVSVFANTSSLYSGSAGTNIFGFNSSNNIYFGKGSNNGGLIIWNNSTARYYTLPDADGTIALVGGSGVGSVTSVAALTIGTSGTDLSSTVANSTTTPVITLNVPTASATNRGALSSADWTTFNNKQNTLTNPVTGTGTTNYLPKWTPNGSTLGNSQIFDNGTNVAIGTASPAFKLDVRTESSSGGATYVRFQNGATMAANNSVSILLGDASDNRAEIRGTTVDTNNGFLSFYTQGSGTRAERMRLDASGNLLLGTTSNTYSSRLAVIGSGNGFLELGQATSSTLFQSNGQDFYLNLKGTGNIVFRNGSGDTERMRITSGGNVLIGTSSDLGLTTGGILQVNNAYGMSITNGGQALRLFRSGVNTWEFGQGTFTSQTGFGLTDATASKTALFIQQTTCNVGIGTTSPAVELALYKSATPRFHLQNSTSGTGDTDGFQLALDGVNGYLWNWENGDTIFGTNNTERMRITSGGNVGIGTTSPNGKMTVVGNTFDIRNGAGGYGTGYALEFSTNANIPRIDWIDNGVYTGNIKSVSGEFIINNSSNNALILNTNNTERMRITSGGNVGIGGTSAPEKLNVVGAIMSTGAITGHGANRTTISQEGASGAYWQSYGANASTVGTFTLRQASSDFSIQRAALTISSAGAVTLSSSIQTGAPSLGAAQPWKLGEAVSGSTSTNYYIKVEINGQIYSIPALQGTP